MQGRKFLKMKIPCFFMVFTWLPIFLLLYVVPSFAESEGYRSIDALIDRYLFGTVGTWSSLFPLPSKMVANYICVFAPVFALVFTYLTLKRSTFERANFDRIALSKIMLLAVGMCLVLVAVIYMVYIGDDDAGKIHGRFTFVGRWRVMYAVWSCASLFLIYILVVSNYLFFTQLPALIYDRIKACK